MKVPGGLVGGRGRGGMSGVGGRSGVEDVGEELRRFEGRGGLGVEMNGERVQEV